MQTRVDKFGRVVIPKHLRDMLGMGPETPVEVVAEGDALRVRVAGQEPCLKRKGHLLVWSGTMAEGAAADPVADERLDRLDRLASL